MDLIPTIGFRKRYTWKEVCGFLGMTRKQLDWLVYGNHALRKRYAGQYPFDQGDLNQFITRFNCGEINPGTDQFARGKSDRPNYLRQKVRAWRQENPEAQRARDAVRNAISKGELIRPESCETCGKKGAVDAHHPDYARPLDVAWLCRSCHRKEHGKRAKVFGILNGLKV